MLYSDPVGEDMLPMEMGIDLEGDEPGEVWKCMFGLCGESRPRKFRNCGDGFVICFFFQSKALLFAGAARREDASMRSWCPVN